MAAAGVARLSVAVGRGRVRRDWSPPAATRQSLETRHRLVQQVSSQPVVNHIPHLYIVD